jgi:hypothetical protein
MAAAVPPAGPQDLAGGQEYYSFSLLIDHQKTVGTASCGGCTSAACLNLISINVKTADLANHVLLTGPANGFDSEWASWQGGGGVVVNGIAGCDGATPTRQRTWGAIKSLYR